MQLSPLQSRLAASFIATVLLIIIYFSLFNPQFALAEELSHGSRMVLEDSIGIDGQMEDLDSRGETYEPEFEAFDRSIIGRAAAGVQSLVNNVPIPMNVNAGESQVFVIEASQIFGQEEGPLELRKKHNGSQEEARNLGREDLDGDLSKRQTSKMVYISANTCIQPQSNSTTTTDVEPPQLTLYVSTSSDNTSPGPSGDSSQQDVVAFTQGAVMYNMTMSSDVYVAVAANNVSSDYSGIYNFQLAASADGWYHSYDESVDADLLWVDSDTHSVLLMTHNLTKSTGKTVDESYNNKSPPYVMFAQNNDDTSINGLKYSYCGLNNYAQIAAVRNGQATSQVTTGITRRGAGSLPKQQFYFSGLNASAKYTGILARNANATTDVNLVGGGGHVYRATSFQTKSTGGNCAVVFNLTFCDQVAYAVPSNDNTFPNTTALGELYDNYAKGLYDGFNKSLQQIACEAPTTQQYSLARNCTDCALAYKDWLCYVTIPRCEDFTSTDPWLQPRNMNQTFPDGSTLSTDLSAPYAANQNKSAFTTARNSHINSLVNPGPYKEILPCEQLCYALIQSCPAKLGFSCPRPWNIGFNTSYGTREDNDGNVTCNYPGAAHFQSASTGMVVPWLLVCGSMWTAAVLLL